MKVSKVKDIAALPPTSKGPYCQALAHGCRCGSCTCDQPAREYKATDDDGDVYTKLFCEECAATDDYYKTLELVQK